MKRLAFVLSVAALAAVSCATPGSVPVTTTSSSPTQAGASAREAWVPVTSGGGALIDSSRYPSGATIEVYEDYQFSGDFGSAGLCLSVTQMTAWPAAESGGEVRFDPMPGSTRCSTDNPFFFDGEPIGSWSDPAAYYELGELHTPLGREYPRSGYPFSSNPVPLRSGVHYYGATFGTSTISGSLLTGETITPPGEPGCVSSRPRTSPFSYPGECLPDAFVIRW